VDKLRTPCSHRGGREVVTSHVSSPQGGDVEFCICTQCRRFWLERNGWLLSRREAMVVLRAWPFAEQYGIMAR
jgi:Zn-finger nucleic acid-binding protein